MATKNPFQVIDDNGNIINPPDPGSDVGSMIYFLEYCRARDFMVGPTIQVGSTIVQVRDLRQMRAQQDQVKAGTGEGDIWKENGFRDDAGGE